MTSNERTIHTMIHIHPNLQEGEQAGGNHGYDAFLPRIEEKCAKMPALPHPEHFQPLGSSAATTSYGRNG